MKKKSHYLLIDQNMLKILDLDRDKLKTSKSELGLGYKNFWS